MTLPRLLFLCQTLPYPPDAGVQIRSYHTLRLLAERYDVTALCFFRRGTRPTQADVEASVNELGKFARVEAFPIPQEFSGARLLFDHVRSVVSQRSYTYYAHDTREFSNRLRALLKDENFEAVHMDSLDLSAGLDVLDLKRVVVTHHNVESALMARRAAEERSPLRRAYLAMQSRLIRKEEQTWCPRVAMNITVSDEDRDILLEHCPGANVTVVPNGVDTTEFQPDPGHGGGVVFVGGHGWFPNADGMDFFCARVLPLIREKVPNVTVTWVGRVPEQAAARYRNDFGIAVTGYVPDIRPYVDAADCFIVPLRVGGGTRLKILDAWALGKAVVSTSIGCEGLRAVNGENILVGDEPAGFADAVVRVLADDGLRLRISRAARETAEQTYDWEVIAGALFSAYRNIRSTV